MAEYSSKLVECHPLTVEEYSKAFQTYICNTTELEEIINLMRPVVESYSGQAITAMSIGAGTGWLEDDMVTKLGLKISYYHAVEPNQNLRKELMKKVGSWENVKFEIDINYFTGKYETDHKFDLILLSHCLYSIDDKDAVILKAFSFLKPKGKLVISLHTEAGFSKLYIEAKRSMKYSSQTLSDQSVTTNTVCNILKKNSIKYELREGPGEIDVTDFIAKQQTPNANDIISFFLQTKFEDLSEAMQKLFYDMVNERVKSTEDGRYVFAQPTSIIIVKRDL